MTEPLRIYDFTGGLNTSSNNYYLKDNETPNCTNITFTKQGAITKRNGYSSIIDNYTITGGVLYLYYFHEKDGTAHLLEVVPDIISGQVGLHEVSEEGGTKSFITVFDGEVHPTFTTLDNKVWISNGEDELQFYDGDDNTVQANAPWGKYITSNKNHLYIAGDPDEPSRLYYTELDDNGLHEWWNTSDATNESFTSNHNSDVSLSNEPIQYYSETVTSTDGNTTYERDTDYIMHYKEGEIRALDTGSMADSTEYHISYSYKDGADHYIDVRTDDGDKITGIIRQSDNLVIFKTNSIHVLYGDNGSNYTLREIIPSKGSIAPRSIVNSNNFIYFLAEDGVYTFNGSSIELISAKIDSLIQDIDDPENASGAWYKHQYLLAHDNDTTLVYHYLYEAWTKYDINASVWSNTDGMVDETKIFFGSPTNGQVYEFDVGTDDDGDDITCRYETKYFDFDSPEMIKTFRKVMVDSVGTGDINLDYNIDRGVDTGTYSITSAEGQSYYGTSLDADAYGRAIKFTVRETSSASLNLYGIVCQYRVKRRDY